MTDWFFWPWLLLLASAFTSATILPGSSEVVMAGMWWHGFTPLLLWVVATFGNVLGSCVNWWLGSQALRFSDRKWFPVKPPQMARAEHWFGRFGTPALLLSALPVVGDPLTIVAGVMRMRLSLFVLMVFIAKGGRYAVLLLAADQLLPMPAV
ncbi:DedA family protein [Rheinheimera riviphila]|uniref:DedA family protein n=1 Tax=Rheinheimera riviphila TaxID=1834037 RepID=A0A437R3B5_9GAMM|nr:YqaA family protein [Rheinheimera riviphila]RVU41268.1 DedA family protein [Rheinheimera riviphila]